MTTRRRHRIPAVVAAAAMLIPWGCASTPVKYAGRPPGQVSLPLDGIYKATIIPPFDFIGPISGRISARPTETGFVASTRPDIAWDMIGGVQGILGSLFVPFIFPGGTIGTWTSSIPEGDKPGEGWFGVGGIKSAGVHTRFISPDQPAELVTDNGRRVGLLKIEPDVPNGPPMNDYPPMAEAIEKAIGDRLYDSELVSKPSMHAYTEQVKYNARLARDDVEFIFGTVAAARNHIKFTIPLVFPKGDPRSRAAMADWNASEVAPIRATLDEKTGLATVRMDAFLKAEDVDRVFLQVLDWKPKGIIIDVRLAPGVTLASLRTLSWVIAEPIDTGVWFGPRQRAAALEGKFDGILRTEISSAASVAAAETILDIQGAVSITVLPESERFEGPVAILTSKRSSASVEPLVWAFKTSKRAGTYGQTTAGKPLLSRPIDIGSGWILWLAAADYRTPAGERLTDVGVKPDFEFATREAAQAAAEKRLLKEAGVESTAANPINAPAETNMLPSFFKAAGEHR